MRRRIPRLSMLLVAVFAAACTQLKQTPQPTVPVTPVGQSPASDAAEIPDPPAFPSTAPTATPTPAATPAPTPRLAVVTPEDTADFTAEALDITFTAMAPEGAAIASATVSYDGRVLATFEGPGPTFKLERWNPNVANNMAEEPDTTPVKAGTHKLTFTATDDQGGVGKLDMSFEKPLKLLGWEESTAMPGPTSHMGPVADGASPPAFITLWGSVDGVESAVIPRTQSYSFNPAGEGSWTTINVTGTAQPRAAYGLALHPGAALAYLVGGRLGAQDVASLDVFSPLRKVAEATTQPLGLPRRDPAVVFLGDHLYAIGGQSNGTILYAVERVKIDADGYPAGAWETRANLQNARTGATAVVQNKEIWVFGGGFRPIEIYDAAKDEWRFMTNSQDQTISSPESWAYSTMIEANKRLYFFGGVKEDGTPIENVHEFNPKTKTWRLAGTLPEIEDLPATERPEARMAGFFHDGSFYLVGGMAVEENRTVQRVFKVKTL